MKKQISFLGKTLLVLCLVFAVTSCGNGNDPKGKLGYVKYDGKAYSGKGELTIVCALYKGRNIYPYINCYYNEIKIYESIFENYNIDMGNSVHITISSFSNEHFEGNYSYSSYQENISNMFDSYSFDNNPDYPSYSTMTCLKEGLVLVSAAKGTSGSGKALNNVQVNITKIDGDTYEINCSGTTNDGKSVDVHYKGAVRYTTGM